MIKFESTREFEWMTFKQFELKKFILIYGILGPLYIFALYFFIKKLDFPSNLFWILWSTWIFVIYPASLIYYRLKPKTYEITSRGIKIDGKIISWKNFKEIIEHNNYLILKGRWYIGSYILPKHLKEHVAYYIKTTN